MEYQIDRSYNLQDRNPLKTELLMIVVIQSVANTQPPSIAELFRKLQFSTFNAPSLS